MNIEDYREYCLSLGNDIEEKLPFQKFKNGEGVLVFYVMGHMFSFFDCNEFSVILLKCQPERIEDLKAQYDCIGNPYNESPKHWIGINPNIAPDDLLQELTRNSYPNDSRHRHRHPCRGEALARSTERLMVPAPYLS